MTRKNGSSKPLNQTGTPEKTWNEQTPPMITDQTSYKPLTRLSGTTIQYYYVCHRELWFHLHYFEPDQENDYLSIGRLINETSFKNRGKKQVKIGNAVLDIIQKEDQQILVTEVKKSSKMLEPTIKQLQYYLYLLKHQGIQAFGIIRVPRERKTLKVRLTAQVEQAIKEAEQGIMRIATQSTPPPYERKPYCKTCAHRELCEA